MPLEIRQIAIRMRVDDGPVAAAPPSAQAQHAARAVQTDRERARIVEDCTQAVLAALAREAQR